MRGPTDPWGLWQSEHATSPSRIGWREVRLICTRCSLWHWKQVSDWVSLSRVRSCAVCTWWHDVQLTSRLAWVLVDKERRLLAWWHVRQTAFFVSADTAFEPRASTPPTPLPPPFWACSSAPAP